MPPELADYLVNWAVRDGSERILEPSCGDGNFLASIARRLEALDGQGKQPSAQICAVELDELEFNKAQSRINQREANHATYTWRRDDFFNAYADLQQRDEFDVVLGNPPFIRFQNFDSESRERAFGFLREAGYKPTKLANAWAAFIQLSIELLAENGRVAMVVPAEIMQVQYAAELRNRIAGVFRHVILIGFKKLVFPEIQQEVVLLLAEGKKPWCGRESDIHTLEIEDGAELATQTLLRNTVKHCPAKHTRPGMKWTSLFLDDKDFEVLDKAQALDRLTPLGHLADVDVGIVTGRNSFFVISQETAGRLSAEPFCRPLVGRTGALTSIFFEDEDFGRYRLGNPAYLLDLNGIPDSAIPKKLKDYIKSAELQDVDKGYKCRIRKRWYDVPSIYSPDAFLYRQIHSHPLLVANGVGATCTDTIHRVRMKSPSMDPRLLAALSVNSLTFAWAEVCGRSYGGGVLELEPREAEELPIPYFPNARIDPLAVDEILRRRNVIDALDYVDRIVLQGEMGMSAKDVRNIRSAWINLKNRRMRRKAA